MIRLFLTILFFFLLLAEGFAGSKLIRLSRLENGGAVLLMAFFDRLPTFERQLNGRRLDLVALDTVAAESLDVPVPDDHIVRTLLSHDQDKTIISFYFRYQPQDLKVFSGPAETLVVELTPGNRITSTYRELTARLGNLEAVDRDSPTLINPLTVSAYSSNWESFFERHQGHSFIELSPRLYFPPFPLTALLQPQQPGYGEFLSYLNELDLQNWFTVLTQVQQKLKSNNEEELSRYLALTYADVLYRLGNMDAAYEQFDQLKQAYGQDKIALVAEYAQALIDGRRGNVYQAHLILQTLSEPTGNGTPLFDSINLSLIESSLATGDYLTAERLLSPNVGPSTSESIKRDLRRADFRFAAGLNKQALAIYEKHLDTAELESQPYSLNGCCTLLYQEERFQDSSRCYQRLVQQLDNDDDRAGALYLATLAAWQSEKPDDVLDRFESIVEQFPGSEAAVRADMKLADICIAQQLDCSDDAGEVYNFHAHSSVSRQIAQEAAFKAALVSHLSGNDREAVEMLQQIRRNFQSGDLEDEVLALIIEVLPLSISSLIRSGKDIEAISLAQQNRDLFLNGWIDSMLLYDLGLAFERLQLHDESLAIFLYLKRFKTFRADEDLYHSLVRLAHARADVGLVDDFGGQYLNRFPQGKYRFDVLYYLIDANLNDGQIELAAGLLPEELPDRKDFKLLAAAINFYQDRLSRAADILLPLYEQADLAQPYLYMLAESLFDTGRMDLSDSIFRRLAETDDYRDASLYRLAMIYEKNNNESQSRALLDLLRTETRSKHWLHFIEQEMRYRQLLSKL